MTLGEPAFPGEENFEAYSKFPIAYSLPHKWGRCTVSEAAHEAYGIRPYREGVASGRIVPANDEISPIDVVILAPHEFGPLPRGGSLSPDSRATNAVVAVPAATDTGIHVALGYERTADEMLLAELQKHARHYGVTVDDVRTRFVDTKHGVPTEERIAFEIPNLLVHTWSEPLEQALAYVLQVREQAGPHPEQPLKVAVASISPEIWEQAQHIARDMHDSFCRQQFERRFMQSLGNASSGEPCS